MCYISDHIFPGTTGKTFLMSADRTTDYKFVQNVLNGFPGISSVELNDEKFPCELVIHASTPIAIKDVQRQMSNYGFHAFPKSSLLHF
uniref:Heavy-metal-associated domain-containing protein n=1 Tax=Roseihalotalea indica TaxID=2867963 RepID=A0AA49GL92_9BACT|nr:hypothetical protein K4G66_24115 [Tunicatimonas sp. TK19036]